MNRHWLFLLIAAIAFSVVVLSWTAVVILRPMPPRTVTMATGPQGGAYYAFGKRYREILAREGVNLRLVPTAGSIENLTLLHNPRSGVSVAFLQGGTTNEKDSPGLESLGTVFYEPLWLFSRSALGDSGLGSLRGRRISIGPEGSGTRALSLALLARNGIDRRSAELFGFTPQVAGEELLQGNIDAAFMIISWDAPVLRRLLASKDIELAKIPRIDAYIALYPFLNKVVVPEGVGNMTENRPPRDVVLLAPKASLVVRSDLHPAIQYLLLDAAEEIHSGPGIFKKAEQFPAPESVDLPLSDVAHQYYRSGEPFLQRYLPFWLAAVVVRLLVLLIPVIGVLYPLLRFLPALYGWKMRRRIYRLYGELRAIERGLENRDIAEQDKRDLDSQLDHLEEKAHDLAVTLSYVGMLYRLREQIALVRERVGNPKG
jgi:TRAP transporter TAXI family solute receptor